MILAAAHCSGTHVIGTYDTHQLQPVEENSGLSEVGTMWTGGSSSKRLSPYISTSISSRASRINLSKNRLRWTMASCIYLGARDNRHMAQTRAIKRFGCGRSTYHHRPSGFHLAYTRDCARLHAFRGLLGCNELGGWDSLGHATLVGAQYRDLGKSGKIHKNHTYSITRSSADAVSYTHLTLPTKLLV